MRSITALALASLLAPLALPLHAAVPTTSVAAAPGQAAQLQSIEALGARLFRLDRAAFVASDQLMAAARGRADPRVQGWITEEGADGITVTFVDATPAALYRVRVDAQGQPVGAVDANPPPLTAPQVAAAQARTVAQAAAPASCSGFYNPIVMPGEADGAWIVYLLPGTADPGVLPLGGAWRIEVRDGVAGAQRPYTNSCIALDNSDPESNEQAFAVTHLLDPVPTEVHVFWSLWAGKPMYVSAGGKLWAIDDGHIRQGPDDTAKAPATMAPKP